jgi:hypothetical protein
MALAALASNRQKLEKLDYSLIDEAALSSISIRLVKSEGRTPHISANSTHGDLVELTVNKVALLAAEMMPKNRSGNYSSMPSGTDTSIAAASIRAS